MIFWCSTMPDSKAYLDLSDVVDSPEKAFKKLSGMDFQDMSKALAIEWKLSDVLLEYLGVDITPETKAVHLGRRISQASKQGWDSPAINKILQSQLRDLGFDVMSAMQFMRDGANEAKALAANYDLQVEDITPDDIQAQPMVAAPTKSTKLKPTSLIRA